MKKRLYRCAVEYLYRNEIKKVEEWRYYPNTGDLNVISDGGAIEAGRVAMGHVSAKEMEPDHTAARLRSVELLSTIDA